MLKKHFLLLFLIFCGLIQPVCGRDIAFRDTLLSFPHDWQEQILQQVDIDELGETAYQELLDELSELVVWNDTTVSTLTNGRLRQHIVLSSNRCLNDRAGYLHQTAELQATNKAYLGSPWHHSLRYRIQLGRHWQTGMTLEKDPGEAWRHTFPGADSWHGFIRLRNVKPSLHIKISDAVIGHYRLRMGSGLVISQGFSLGKQYLTQQMLSQRTNVITPHASLSESGFMQGAALDLRFGQHLSLLPYFSARQIDGTLDDNNMLTALQTDGYHRTFTETSHRQAAWQFISGARLGWRSEWFDIGVHGSYTHLQHEYRRNLLYYNTHYFRGHQLAHLSTDYTVRALGGLLRGEWALDDKGASACINALQYNLGDYWQGTLLHRYYTLNYRQLHASSISESSGMQGEEGVMLQIDGQPLRYWQVQGMIDLFKFSQPQYGIRDSTSQGFEATLRLLYQHNRLIGRSTNATFGYRIKKKGDYYRHTFDGVLTLQPHSSLSLKTQLRGRIHSLKNQDPTYGYAVSQSVGWQSSHWAACPFSIVAQACYFHTEDYNSRIYLTERTILYGFGLPMLYGEGVRYSLTGTLAIGSQCHIDLKWALTNYANRATISSGLQQISGNTQQDVWLQLRLKI